MNFLSPESHIHILSRALLISGDQVVLCRAKGKTWYFLPGGHVEDGETFHQALARELQEELSLTHYSAPEFIGICEYSFPIDAASQQHELNVIFRVDVGPGYVPSTTESHLEFTTVPLSEIGTKEIRPDALKAGLLEWLSTGKSFFRSWQ